MSHINHRRPYRKLQRHISTSNKKSVLEQRAEDIATRETKDYPPETQLFHWKQVYNRVMQEFAQNEEI